MKVQTKLAFHLWENFAELHWLKVIFVLAFLWSHPERPKITGIAFVQTFHIDFTCNSAKYIIQVTGDTHIHTSELVNRKLSWNGDILSYGQTKPHTLQRRKHCINMLGSRVSWADPCPSVPQWESQLFTDYNEDITWQTFWPQVNVWHQSPLGFST